MNWPSIVLGIAVALIASVIGEECKMRTTNRMLLTICSVVIASILFHR